MLVSNAVLNEFELANSINGYSGTQGGNGWTYELNKGSYNIPLFLGSIFCGSNPKSDLSPSSNNIAELMNPDIATRRFLIDIYPRNTINVFLLDFSVRKVGLKELWALKWHRNFDTADPWL